MKQYDIIVDTEPSEDLARLDKWIPAKQAELSRSLVRQLIERGAVYLNGKRCKRASKPIFKGDTIRVFLPEKTRAAPTELTAAQIIFEDQDWIIVNKPPFLPTHATLDNSREHLVSVLQEFIAKRDGKDAKSVYIGVHHRLDRDTSGVILFTKRKEANAAIAKAFQERTVDKTYLAAVLGEPKEKRFVIKSYLGRDPRNKRRFCSVKSGGDYAETEVKLLATRVYQGKTLSLVEAHPVTGRTHQIRVHLSEQALPLAGDETYGTQLPGIRRLMLHAYKLNILGKSFLAPMPQEFRQLDFAFHEE